MKAIRPLVLAGAALLVAPAFAQSDAQCIVAGRLSGGLWAPLFTGVHLFAADGRPAHTPSHAALRQVRRVVLDQPALLSRCDGDGPLAQADGEPPAGRQPAPALAAGATEVEGVAFPKLRTGGELVELRVRVPPERVVTVTRQRSAQLSTTDDRRRR